MLDSSVAMSNRKTAIERGNSMKILMVLTSHDKLGNTGHKSRLLARGIGCSLLCIQGCGR